MATTCSNQHLDDDDKVWAIAECWPGFKSWFRSKFNLQKDQWDEGWGWKKCDPSFAFPKMYNAGLMLAFGLEDPTSTVWGAVDLAFNSQMPVWRNPSVVLDTQDTLHVFGGLVSDVSASTSLIHYFLPSQQQVSGAWAVENLTDLVGHAYEVLYGELTAFSESNGNLHVFAQNTASELLHYHKTSTGWAAEDITTKPGIGSAYRMDTRLVTEAVFSINSSDVTSLEPMLHVFGTKYDVNGLIHCYRSQSGSWSAEIVPALASNYAMRYPDLVLANKVDNSLHVFGRMAYRSARIYYSWVPGTGWSLSYMYPTGVASGVMTETQDVFSTWCVPTGVVTSRGVLHVFDKSASEDLIHFYNSGSGWTAENLTNQLGTAFRPDHPASLSTLKGPQESVHVLGAKGFDAPGDLIHYYLLDGGPTYQISNWKAENLTSLPNVGPDFRVYGSPVAVAATGHEPGLHIFARNSLGGDVIHYMWSLSYPSNWTVAENLSTGRSGKRIYEDPIVISDPNSLGARLHVFGTTDGPEVTDVGHLIYYGWFALYGFSWHTPSDYIEWASGDVHGFRYEPEKSDAEVSNAYWGAFQTDRVAMMCPSFNDFGPGTRAGAMVHEAGHIIYDLKHQVVNGVKKDEWVYHRLGEGRGNLSPEWHRHTMYQIQVEWLADIAEFARGWVPRSISDDARDHANAYISCCFTNAVPWKVGEPRPLT